MYIATILFFLFPSLGVAAETVSAKVVLRSEQFDVSKNDTRPKTRAEQLAAKSFDLECEKWKTAATRKVEVPYESPDDGSLYRVSVSLNPSCSQHRNIIQGDYAVQFEAEGAVSFRLPARPEWLSSARVLVVTAELDPGEVNLFTIEAGLDKYKMNCQKWKEDLQSYSRSPLLFSYCENPKQESSGSTAVDLLGKTTAALIVVGETETLSEEFETKVLDTDDSKTDRVAAKEQIDRWIQQWKLRKLAEFGNDVVYMTCSPAVPVQYRAIQLKTKCQMIVRKSGEK
ncbi:MAG: hypothetical protein AB1540_01725 [Bdellovibrionota bacterium]